MQAGNNFSSDIGIDKFFGKFEMFSKDIEFPVTSNKSDDRDCSLGDIVDFWEFELWRRQDWHIAVFSDEL